VSDVVEGLYEACGKCCAAGGMFGARGIFGAAGGLFCAVGVLGAAEVDVCVGSCGSAGD